MNIAIIGAGNLGTGLAKHLVRGGHQVFLSFSRNAEETARLRAQLAPNREHLRKPQSMLMS
jgi:predicted dinucleotide-binding enzyme